MSTPEQIELMRKHLARLREIAVLFDGPRDDEETMALNALIETAERYQALQDAGYRDITVLAAKPAMNNFAGRRKGETKHMHAHSLDGLADRLKRPQ